MQKEGGFFSRTSESDSVKQTLFSPFSSWAVPAERCGAELLALDELGRHTPGGEFLSLFAGDPPSAGVSSGAVPVMTFGTIIFSSWAGPVDDAGAFGAVAAQNSWLTQSLKD